MNIFFLITLFVSFESVLGVKPGDPVEVADDQLIALSSELWKISGGMIKMEFNFGQETSKASEKDMATDKLIRSVNTTAIETQSFTLLEKLFDNYIADQEKEDEPTAAELKEITEFVDYVLNTPVIVKVRDFIFDHGYLPTDIDEFNETFRRIWFDTYKRRDALGSSGFEHVFIGETNGAYVSGFHNWYRYYLLEASGNMNYMGWLNHTNSGSLVTMKMTWKNDNTNYTKNITTISFGTTPEYEMAMYTLCFFVRRGKLCPVEVGGLRADIQTTQKVYNRTTYVGTSYFMIVEFGNSATKLNSLSAAILIMSLILSKYIQ